MTDAEQAIAEHQAVLDALASGDPETAAAMMTEHVQKVRGRAMADAPAE
ncbi:FCD domain-containing protein [Bacillus sp. SIMBA_026]